MGSPSSSGYSDDRDESEAERLDRNYGELLQELRVLQAGVQILFAFLLTIAFQQRFASVSDFQRNTYLASLMCAALATVCIIAPVAFHRIVFRRGMKDDLMNAATRYVAAGMLFLFLAMVGAVFLVLDFLLSRVIAVSVSGGLVVAFVVLWVVVPYVSRAAEDDDEQDSP
ncbi:MAG: DUF6328 family protein [Nocardioidaceae bacterium]